MNQQLWVVNSSLIILFVIALAISAILRFEVPSIRVRTIMPHVSEKKKESTIQRNWEKIYKNDLFKTFTPVVKEAQQQSFVTPVPEPQQPTIPTQPTATKPDFIPTLPIIIKGIIINDDDTRNVVMIEDETKKEGLYHLGDKIKDAQIIKIARNRVVLLRANGQQELLFLRKDDPLLDAETDEKWNYIIKKTSENNYEIDPSNFAHEVEGLGYFMERLSIVGIAPQKGTALGIKIGEQTKEDLGTRLGLEKNDIIISVNNYAMNDPKSRILAYDAISAMSLNDTITAKIQRAGKEIVITYRLTIINKAKKRTFTTEPIQKQPILPTSILQEREKNIREFENRHGETEQNQQEAVAAIRQRLLQNLRTRLQDTRTR